MLELDTDDLYMIAEALDFTITMYSDGIDITPSPEDAEDLQKTKDHIVKMEALLSLLQLTLDSRGDK